jgi:hypothetical protein
MITRTAPCCHGQLLVVKCVAGTCVWGECIVVDHVNYGEGGRQQLITPSWPLAQYVGTIQDHPGPEWENHSCADY